MGNKGVLKEPRREADHVVPRLRLSGAVTPFSPHSSIFMPCSDDLTVQCYHYTYTCTESTCKTADETEMVWSRYEPLICPKPLRTNTTNVSQNGRYFNKSLKRYRCVNLFGTHISHCTSAHVDSSQWNNGTGWWRNERPAPSLAAISSNDIVELLNHGKDREGKK